MAAVGALGGFLSGLLGIGGALVFIPVFTHYIGNANVGIESVPYLLANSFFIVFVAGLSASFKQYKMKNLHPKQAFFVAIPATIIALLVIKLIDIMISNGYEEIKIIFKFVFLSLLFFIVIQTFMSAKKTNYNLLAEEVKPHKFLFSGLFVGFFSGITGLGGGSIMLPIFHNFLKIKYTISTSLSSTVIALFTVPSLIYYAFLNPINIIYPAAQSGYICWPLVLPIVPFIIIFSQLGVKYNHQFPVWLLKTIFAVIIIINIYKIIFL